MFNSNQKDFCAMWVSNLLGLTGPSCAVYSACSSSLTATRQAMNALMVDGVDLCLAGAVHLVNPDEIGHNFQPGMVLSSEPHCRPFDAAATGIVRGSAVGVVVLKLAKKALHDGDAIQAVIKSCALNNDGSRSKANFTAPSAVGQAEVMRAALAQSGIDNSDVAYLECHATGTAVGDAIELKAVSDVYACEPNPEHPLVLGSIKANIGHAFAGASMASLAKCMQILSTKTIPPQINLENAMSLADGLTVNTAVAEMRERRGESTTVIKPAYVALNSFGIGGTNASMVLMEGDKSWASHERVAHVPVPLIHESNEGLQEPEPLYRDYYLFPISGATPEAVIRNCQAVADYVEACVHSTGIDIERVASTLQMSLDRHRYRLAVLADSTEKAIEKLRAATASDAIDSRNGLSSENVAFFFAPQGVQYPGMLQKDLAHSTFLENSLHGYCEMASNAFKRASFKSFKDVLNDGEAISDPRYAQCAVFVVWRTISTFLTECGISASVLMGHSVGEYAALAQSQALDDSACIQLLARRGDLVARTERAKMVTVKCQMETLEGLVVPNGVEISAYVADNIFVLVGPHEVMSAFLERLREAKIEHRELKTERGFHSYMLDPIVDEFKAYAEDASVYSDMQVPVISNVDGSVMKSPQLNAAYLTQHLRRPVRVDLTLDTLIHDFDEISCIVEIGPPGLLQTLLRIRKPDIKVICTVPSRSESTNVEEPSLLRAIASLWCLGHEVDFRRLYGDHGHDWRLPGLCFITL
ncbi:hypothetical protein AAVH_03477 [Aphelenchoides avenae]|nr:hypothetical protein AAVH_03477 [Aphelenchus avenae]